MPVIVLAVCANAVTLSSPHKTKIAGANLLRKNDIMIEILHFFLEGH
jgi:hypothetical protein